MRLVSLGRVAEVNPRLPKDAGISAADEVAFLPMDAVSEDGSVAYQQRRRMDEVTNGYTSFRRGDILLAKITPCMENGKAAYLEALGTEYGFGSTEFHVLRPSQDLDGRYAFYLIWNPRFRHLAECRMTGSAGQKRVPASFLKELEIPLPPPAEQRRIAAILDKADAIRRKHQQALALADDFLRSTFLHMFGDPATNPRKFETKRVERVLSSEKSGIQSGPFGSSLKKHEYVPKGVPVWGIDNVQQNRFVPDALLFITPMKYEQLRRYDVIECDILISRAGTVGRMCIARGVPQQSIISTNIVRVRLDYRKVIPEYFVNLFTYFSHRLGGLKSNQKENAFTFLNPATLKALEIPIPPIEAQRSFVAVVKKRDALARRVESDMAEAECLFGSLSQRAFHGEL